MRICIVGCGAVGSLFAANLAQLDDVEVWAYDASREHVDAINAKGLRLSGAGEVVGRLSATTDAQELPPCDFGIVATKAMHTEAATRAAAHAFRDGSVATVQNGLGNEETLAEHVERVIRGTTFPAGKILEPGAGDRLFSRRHHTAAWRERASSRATSIIMSSCPPTTFCLPSSKRMSFASTPYRAAARFECSRKEPYTPA